MNLVGVPLVGLFTEYQNAFYYALALLWGVEIPQLELSDRAAHAALALATHFQGTEPPSQEPQGDSAKESANTGEGEQGDICVEWDEPLVSLPQELAALWPEIQQGLRKMNLVSILEQLPKFSELPLTPAENYSRTAGKSQWDRQLRGTSNPFYIA